MTKHNNDNDNHLSKFFVKITSDWCHLCGKRSSPFIEISYPENAEVKLKEKINLSRQIQGSRHTVNVYNNLENYTEEEEEQSTINFVRICKKCLGYAQNTLYTYEHKIKNL